MSSLLIPIAAAVLTCGFFLVARSHNGMASQAQAAAQTWTVTSSADSGLGTLRQALLQAHSGDTITFDAAIFPPTSPVTITLNSGLPDVGQGNLTVGAANAGVILDGSQIGATPEALLLDDVSLTLDGGPNLVVNGDFNAGLGHWRPWPWEEGPGMTRSLNSSDFHSSPQSYQWSSVAHAGEGRTVYDAANTNDPFDSDPYYPGSTVWMPVTDGSTTELHFWYRHGPVRVTFSALFQDGHVEQLSDGWFDWQAGWTKAVVSRALPANTAGVALELGYGHSERWTNGFSIASDGNVVQGLQIVGFPNAGVGFCDGVQNNLLGGDRSIGSGPLGQGNLISGNGSYGVGLWGEDTSYNTIRGNTIGADLSGTTAWGGRRDGIHSNGASHNLIEDNLIGGYGTGVYLCCASDGHNTVRGNRIGTDVTGVTDVGNDWAGVAIDRSGANVIVANVIAHNGGPGIAVYATESVRNRITRNSVHDNGGPGILLGDGGNTELAAPLVFNFDLSAGTLSGNACANCTIEIFSDSSDEGAIYEGQAVADGSGAFTLNKGAPFAGPHLTTTATDADGNTSEFSLQTTGSGQERTIQAGNGRPISPLYAQCSSELTDNHLGTQWGHVRNTQEWGDVSCAPQGIRGFKMVRLAFNEVEDWPSIDWSQSEFNIRSEQDALVTGLAKNGITVTYLLNFWDKANHPNGWPQISSRFTTEEEIQRYLEYVRFIVGHFKGRVRYFELWNEPDAGSVIQHIRPQDYVELVKRVAPVIRDEYPEAKIVVGSVAYLRNPYARYYLYYVIQSEVMPLVDVVTWHPMYGTSPDYEDERDYYYAYPGILRDIKETAIARGFSGEFRGDEIGWCSPDLNDCGAALHIHTNITAAKYHTRGVVMHLGEDVATHLGGMSDLRRETSTIISNLATVLAGARAESLPIQVRTTITDVVSYTFALANNAHLVAIYNDAPAAEEDAGVDTALIVPGFAGQTAIGIDPLHSLVQTLITRDDGHALVIENVRVKDYVLFIRLVPRQRAYLPIVRR